MAAASSNHFLLSFPSSFPFCLLPPSLVSLPNNHDYTRCLFLSFTAQHILSFDPQSLKAFAQTQTQPLFFNSSTSAAVFSVPLHSRGSVHKTHHTDYKALVASRLDRDSARVDSLSTKLLLALNGVKKSQLRPLPTQIQAEALSYPHYFRNKPREWRTCNECYQQSDPIFNPSGSSTYSPVTCESKQCSSLEVSACRSGKCLYQVSYDSVVGNSGNMNGVALGCGHDNEGLFVGAAGLLGLGGGPLWIVIRPARRLWIFNSGLPADSVIAPLMKSRKVTTFYYIGLTGFSVGGQAVNISPGLFEINEAGEGGVIIDCGTAITRLQTQAYNALRDAFVKQTQGLPSASGVAFVRHVLRLVVEEQREGATVAFISGKGNHLIYPAKNYLIPVDSSGTFCFAFAPTSSSMSIIGNVQQQGTRVSFDLANNRVGFSSRKC
ncbi:hypothetical protein V6Z11_1Z059800 [Gossypium hirsutum]